MKFLVVGTGRCGTGYMSKLLHLAGLPCGHESIYTVGGIVPSATLLGDSSWLAVPHIHKLKGSDTTIVHIVRDPLKIFRSWLFDQNNVISLNPTNIDSPFNRYIRNAFPSIDKQKNQVDKAAIYYIQCNTSIAKQAKDNNLNYQLFRVEDSPKELIESLGGNSNVEYSAWTSYNSRDKKLAGNKEVIKLIRESKYYNTLVEAFSCYYPELYNEQELLGDYYNEL